MRKYLICIAAISVAGCLASGCESEGQNALKLACEGSGGEFIEDKGACKCKDICDPGVICNAEMTCSAKSNPDCQNGFMRCDEKTVQKCVGGVWTNQETCELTSCIKKSDMNAICADCKENDEKCESISSDTNSGVFSRCTDGEWTKIKDCKCATDKKCTECAPGDKEENKCSNNPDTGIGEIPVCTANGEWGKENCEGDASCTPRETCGICQNDSIKCTDADGKGIIDYCLNGNWSTDWEYSEERVNAILAKLGSPNWTINHNRQCEVYNQEYYSPARLQCSSDGTRCAECNGIDKKCFDLEKIGSKLYSCNTGKWDKSEDIVSCNSEHNDLGVCLNGQYRISDKKPKIPSDCNELSIDICSSGIHVNTQRYEHAIRCNNNTISLYSAHTSSIDFNINNNVTIDNQMQPFECSLLLDDNANIDATFKTTSCPGGGSSIFNVCQKECNVSDIESFIKYYYGLNPEDSIQNLPSWFWYSQGMKVYYRWFDCNTDSCNKLSFCVDAVSVEPGIVDNDNDATYYKGDHSLVLTFEIVDSENLKVNFKSAPDGCNSNRTDNAYDYDQTSECSEYAIGSSVKYIPNDLSEFNFRVCRYKGIRDVSCNNLFDKEKFSCIFSNTTTAWFDSTICIDFYNKLTLQKASYAFTPASQDTPFDGTASIKESQIIECPNGCNGDWTACAP